jgi:hypothetical protein
MERRQDLKFAPGLLITAFQQFTRLMQNEVALAKAEMSRNIARAGGGLAMIGIAALLALTALNVLAGALVAYLATTGLTAGTAAVLVGAVLLVIALVLVLIGKSRLSADAISPTKTTESIKSDLEIVRKHSHA